MPTRWRAIADDLRTRIGRGEWAPGERIPAQRKLTHTYGTSPSTVSRAMAALVSEGILRSDPTAPRNGMHVRTRHLVRRPLDGGLRIEHQRAVTGDATDVGLFEADTGVDVDFSATYTHDVTDPEAAAALGLPPNTPLLLRTFRYAISGEPHQMVWSHLPETTAQAAGLVDETAEIKGRGTIAQLRDAGIVVDRVEIELESRIPTPPEVCELAIPTGVPVVVQRRISHADGRPVAVDASVVPGDRIIYTLTVDLPWEDRPDAQP